MTKLKEEFLVAMFTLKNSKGKKYSLASKSLTGGDDFFVTSGVIADAEIDYTLDILVITLSDGRREHFTLSALKDIEVVKGLGDTMMKVIYNDNSYFKIYIN
jgi:hypothetical protein